MAHIFFLSLCAYYHYVDYCMDRELKLVTLCVTIITNFQDGYFCGVRLFPSGTRFCRFCSVSWRERITDAFHIVRWHKNNNNNNNNHHNNNSNNSDGHSSFEGVHDISMLTKNWTKAKWKTKGKEREREGAKNVHGKWNKLY